MKRNLRLGMIAAFCVSGCTVSAPPDRLAASRTWQNARSGFLFEISYFNAAQVRDQRWEAKRLEMMEQTQICQGGKKIIKRDVRWFKSTPVSGMRCATVIYTVQCDSPTLVPTDNLGELRRLSLIGPLRAPIKAKCGEKDRSKPAVRVQRSPD